MKKLLLLLLLAAPALLPAADGTSPAPVEKGHSDSKGYLSLKKIKGALKDRITINAYAQLGFDYNSQSSPRDEFKVARVVAYATGQVTDALSARVMLEFKSSSLLEAWADYKFSPALRVKVGQFKTPFSIENPLSPTVLELVGCNALVTGYMVAGSSSLTMPGSGGRDVGLQVYGSLLDGLLGYNLALMNGQGRNKSDANSQKDFVARLDITPVKGLLLSGSMMRGTGNVAVTPSADGTRYVSTAADIEGLHANGNFRRDRYALGAALTTRPLNLRTEFMAGIEGKSHSRGCYATASLNRVAGNLDLIASYDWLDTWAGCRQRYTGGLQYWFYPKCRAQLGYSYGRNASLCHESTVQAQIQVAF